MHLVATRSSSDAKKLPETMPVPMTKSGNRGRQRSEESEEAILCATLHLLKEKPLRDITIEEIARKAGVGKATIYKWWPSKAYVALDAFLRKTNRMVPTPDTGSAENDFREQLSALVSFFTSPTGRIFSQFLAEGQSDKEFATLFRERFVKPRREAVGVIFDRGVKRGEIDRSLDRELVLDLIYGPAILRLMAGHAPLDRHASEAVISALFAGLRDKTFKADHAKRRKTQAQGIVRKER
ncbi:MAG: TetR family transcriptional regulator [Acidobacteria bacterium]|nr:MAG: TetR family transcriptional regulator [Acidobacteriota bacterium]